MSEAITQEEQPAEERQVTYFNLSVGGPLDKVQARIWIAYSDGEGDQRTFEGSFGDVLEAIGIAIFGEAYNEQ